MSENKSEYKNHLSDKPKTLIQKLHEGFKYFNYLQKDKKNTFHKYTYVSEANIKEHAQKMCRELGIVFKYVIEDIKDEVIMQGDKPVFSTTIKIHYYFINTDDPSDVFEGITYGAAQDTGDKGLYKAITGGLKYIFFTTFLVPSGDEPEESDVEEQISSAIVETIPRNNAPLTKKPTITSTSKPVKSAAQQTKPDTPKDSSHIQPIKDTVESVIKTKLGGKVITEQSDDIAKLRAKFMELKISPEAKQIIEDMDKCTSVDELRGVWALIPTKERKLVGVTEFKDIKKHELLSNAQ